MAELLPTTQGRASTHSVASMTQLGSRVVSLLYRYLLRPLANRYVRYGALSGLPVPLAFFAAELWLRPGPVALAQDFGALLRHPLAWVLLLYPLLLGWVFGLIGTLAEEKDLRILELIYLLSRQARRDGLTNLFNHAHVVEYLQVELERAQRERHPVSCLMIDMDNLKQINDTHGHLAGDRVLMELAGIIKGAFRPYDVVGRYGGDEFLVVLLKVGEEEAAELAERVRRRVAEQEFVLPRSDRRVHSTVSVGIATFPADGATRAVLLAAADQAMYRAKVGGKNRVHSARDLAHARTGARPPDGTPAPPGRAGVPAPAPAVVPAPGPAAAAGAAATGAAPAAARATTVLVIDDEPDTVLLLRDLLDVEGYRVLTADSGPQALEIVGAQTPDLILLDLAMPGMNGIDFCRTLADRALARGVPIIIITAHEFITHPEQVLVTLPGVRLFLSKPFDPNALLEQVRVTLADRLPAAPDGPRP